MTTKSDQLAAKVTASMTTVNMNDVSKPEVRRIGDWNVTPITAYLQTEKKYYYSTRAMKMMMHPKGCDTSM